MNAITILRVIFFNVFLIICFSLIIYGQDDTKIIWIHEFQDVFGQPDTLSMTGAYYLFDFLEDYCIELCSTKSLVIYFQIDKEKDKRYQKREQDLKADSIILKSTKPKSGEGECVITTTYKREKSYYRITSNVQKVNHPKKKIPTFRLPYKLNNNGKIDFTGDLLKTHAESIADILYEIYNLQFSKVEYYIYPQPMVDLKSSLVDFDKIPQTILDRLIKVAGGGKVKEAKSDSTNDAILEVDLQSFGSNIIINVTIEDSSGHLANSQGSFKLDDVKSYGKSIDDIAKDLINQIMKVL